MHVTHEVHSIAKLEPLEMSVIMMKVDIKRGGYHSTMRYYILQLLREKLSGQFTLWTRWGRMGERGQNQKTPFNLDEAGAVKEFKKVLKQKSGLVWENLGPHQKPVYLANKYRIVQLGMVGAEKRIVSQYRSLTSVVNINSIVKAFEDDLKQTHAPENVLLKDSVV